MPIAQHSEFALMDKPSLKRLFIPALSLKIALIALVLATMTAPKALAQTTGVPTETGGLFPLAPGLTEESIDYWKDYSPTMITTDKELNSIFKTMKGAKMHSQCFNRAHVWTYEASQKYKRDHQRELRLMKVFMFYSTPFMAKNKFDWWFHVAPAVFVGDPGTAAHPNTDNLLILDRLAYRQPVNLWDWVRYFVSMQGTTVQHAECKIVHSYHEFVRERDSQTEDCFQIIVPMYYHYGPDDFAQVERYGKPYKDLKWSMDELDRAQSEAFIGSLRDY